MSLAVAWRRWRHRRHPHPSWSLAQWRDLAQMHAEALTRLNAYVTTHGLGGSGDVVEIAMAELERRHDEIEALRATLRMAARAIGSLHGVER